MQFDVKGRYFIRLIPVTPDNDITSQYSTFAKCLATSQFMLQTGTLPPNSTSNALLHYHTSPQSFPKLPELVLLIPLSQSLACGSTSTILKNVRNPVLFISLSTLISGSKLMISMPVLSRLAGSRMELQERGRIWRIIIVRIQKPFRLALKLICDSKLRMSST